MMKWKQGCPILAASLIHLEMAKQLLTNAVPVIANNIARDCSKVRPHGCSRGTAKSILKSLANKSSSQPTRFRYCLWYYGIMVSRSHSITLFNHSSLAPLHPRHSKDLLPVPPRTPSSYVQGHGPAGCSTPPDHLACGCSDVG